jgi:hypothetical protein
MILYENFITLPLYETFKSLNVEYIATTFNINTRNAIHVIAIYKPSTTLISTCSTCYKIVEGKFSVCNCSRLCCMSLKKYLTDSNRTYQFSNTFYIKTYVIATRVSLLIHCQMVHKTGPGEHRKSKEQQKNGEAM